MSSDRFIDVDVESGLADQLPVQVATSAHFDSLSESLRRQQSEMVRSFAAAAGAPAMRGLRWHEGERLQEMFKTLSADPELRRVRQQNQQIAATIGRLKAGVVVDEPSAGKVKQLGRSPTRCTPRWPRLPCC